MKCCYDESCLLLAAHEKDIVYLYFINVLKNASYMQIDQLKYNMQIL